MSERIDLDIAKAVMAQAAEICDDPAVVSHAEFITWSKRIEKFSELAAAKRLKSYVPVLGNALLAKASNPRVDVFSLKVRDKSQGAYDARRTAEKVLVPASHKYEFSLGTSGAQPLNNQPFFRVIRIDSDLPVRAHAAELRDSLLSLLHEVQQLRTEEAVRGLAAFVAVRKKYLTVYGVAEAKLAISTGDELATAVDQFVGAQSDGGGRAQAVAGGLMDALFTSDRVRVGKKNEPDRKMPGDVGVRATATPDSPFVRILEVRDKNVPEHAVQSFISKVAAADVRRAVLVCVAATQEQLSIPDLQAHAHRRGVDLEIFTDWSTLIRTVVFASERTEIVTVESAVAAIRSRLIELELPADTVTAWDAATSADAVE